MIMAADLFTWREEAEAAKRAQEAEEARAAALRRYRIAPRGAVRTREARLAEATRHALEAEVRLAQLQAQGRPE